MDLCGLPSEILAGIAGALRVRDVAMLGATNHAIRAVVADDAMWRVLFVRDFAHLYAEGLAAEPWPHPTHPDDPWHEIALQLWEGTDAIERMPPRCPPVPHLPAPFAHAFAVGKDWLWLYKAHAIVNPDGLSMGPATRPSIGAAITRGDGCFRSRPNYRVVIEFEFDDCDHQRPVSWTEIASGWAIECTDQYTRHVAYLQDAIHCVFAASRVTHERTWTLYDSTYRGRTAAITPSGHRVDGAHNNGARNNGAPTHLVTQCVDGHVVHSMYQNRHHGVAHMFYSNGDVARMLFEDDRFVNVQEFTCSPLCPRREYAGKRIVGCRWRMETVVVNEIPLKVPVPSDGSNDARAFWSYVREGLVGWHPDTRRAILDAMAASS